MSEIAFETCRICQATVSLENILQIVDNTCTRFLEEIFEISGMNFKGVFEQPWFICMKCYTDLLTAQGFRKKCIETYQQQNASQPAEEVPSLEDLLEEEPPILPQKMPEINTKESSKSQTDSDSSRLSKICEICGNVFQGKRNFALHLRRHTDNKAFECEFCPYKSHTNAELNCHMRKHTGEKPYECKYCHRKFSDYGTHKKHERTHTNERPFSCNICLKAFTSTFILKNHILTHSGKRAFECKVCGRSFVFPSHLTSHLKSMVHLRNCKKVELERDEANSND